MMRPRPAPSLFVSHGAPTFALEPGILGPKLKELGAKLTDLAAVAVVSAHWQTSGVQVMRTPMPATIHDFGGFPPALYRLRYPAAGAPALAAEAAALLDAAGIAVSFDDERGLDHGVWVPLLHLLPEARVPVFQVSLPLAYDAERALQLGKALRDLRRQGVLIMGSGSLTHNLREIGHTDPSNARYAFEFTAWVREHLKNKNRRALIDYRRQAPHALRAHPSEEHFLPLLVALGASDDEDAVDVIEGGMTYEVLSMESYIFGGPA